MQSQKSSPSLAAMLSEAHHLYNILWNKIAHSRTIRRSKSLHKKVLVNSVLHKTSTRIVEIEDIQQYWAYSNYERLKLSRETGQPTISVLREIRPTNSGMTQNSLKHRKTVSEWETEEAVRSILPKKSKSQLDDSGVADLFPEIETELADPNDPSTTMEIDCHTSRSLANLDALAAPALPSVDLISLQEAENSSSEKENSLHTTYLDFLMRPRDRTADHQRAA